MGQPGYAKGRATRREITLQAMALFGEVGYRGASLREVATRCSLSHPGLLYHFPTKEALLQAVLEERDADDIAWLTEGGVTGVDALRRLMALVERNTTRRGIVELFCVLSAEATSSDHPAHDWFVRRYRTSIASITHTYEEVRDAGRLRQGIAPGAAARQLVALMDGLQVQWLLDDVGTDMVGVVRDHVESQIVSG